MTPRPQLIAHDPESGAYGDCYRTCLATILDLPSEAVPHFYREENWERPAVAEQEARDWLGGRGLGSACFAYAGDSMDLATLLAITAGYAPGVPMILSGRSELGCNHAVVIMSGTIVCDPSGNGIVGPMDCDQWQVEVLAVAADWRGRTELPS